MVHQLTWQTSPGLRGLVCSKFRAVIARTPDHQRGVAISLENDDEREALLAELEMHFAAQRFSSDAAAFEAVKAYALERAGGKRPK
jgi:hypothetical protein